MQMENKIRFGSFEAVTFISNLICTKIFLYYTRLTVEDAATAGWISSIVSGLAAFLMLTVLLKMYKKFDDKDILDIAEIAGGKFLKIVTGAVITFSLFVLTVVVIRKFSEDMKIVSLPSSPLSYVMSFFLVGIAVACFFGLEAIVRFHAIVIPFIIAGYVSIMLGVTPQMDITNLMPFWGTGIDDILSKGFLRSSVYCELLVLFLLPPFLGGYKKITRVGYTAFALSAISLITSSLVYILANPYPSGMEPFLPIYNMTRLIAFGRFFQRIEALFVFTWAMAALLYLTSTFYFMVYTFAKTAGLKYIRPLVLPFAVIVFSAAFIPGSLMEVIRIEKNYIVTVGWIVAFVYTGLILAAASIRKSVRKEKCSK